MPNRAEFESLEYVPKNQERPTERMEVGNNRNFNTPGWGIELYGEMFSERQIFFLNNLVRQIKLLSIQRNTSYDKL